MEKEKLFKSLHLKLIITIPKPLFPFQAWFFAHIHLHEENFLLYFITISTQKMIKLSLLLQSFKFHFWIVYLP